MTKLEKIKKDFERESTNLLMKYAWKFIKKGYIITQTTNYVGIKNNKFYNKVKDRPAIKLEKIKQ
jgi:hypothetical protein